MRQVLNKLGRKLRRWSYQPPFTVVLQSDESECGLASLAMMFAALGKPVKIEALRKDYGSTRGGTTIGDLTHFAERYGFRAIPSRIPSDDLQRVPSILFVRDDHFSVLWAIEKDRYFIADPSDGCLVLDAEQFSNYYSGISIAMRPIPRKSSEEPPAAAATSNENQTTLLPLTNQILSYVIALAIVIAIVTVAIAAFQDIFMTYVVEEGQILWTKGLINLTVGFAIVLSAASFVLQLIVQRFLQTNILNWNLRIFRALLSAPYDFFISKTTGLISSRFNQVDESLSGFQSAALTALLGSLNLLIFLVAVLLVSRTLALLALAGIASFLFVGIKFFGYNLQNSFLLRQAECATATAEFKLISNRDQIIIEHSQRSMMRELATSHINLGINELKINRYANLNEFYLALVENILNSLLLVISALLIIQGSLTTGSYAAVSVIIGTALQPIRSVAQIIETLQSSTQSFQVVNDLFQPQELPKAEQPAKADDNTIVNFQNLSFRYSLYDQWIIRDLNARIVAGPKRPIAVHLTGDTGAGKTTLFNLLLGFLTPTSGRLLIAGSNIANLPQAERNQLVQFVDRNPLIITGSVLTNVLLGTPASAKDIQPCLVALGLSDEPLFREYSHRILLDASSVSTGQAVMIALVRAALTQPKLLLLDEALTSLPEERHRKVVEGIGSLGIHLILVQHGISQVLSDLARFEIKVMAKA